MRNNTSYSWKCWLLLLFVVTSSCGGEPGLLVRLAAWPEGAENLRVVRWFDGEKRDEIIVSKSKGERGFVVTIPEGTTGELRMQITAQDSGDCKVARAEVTERLGPGFHYIQDQDVSLTPLPSPTCQLVLEFPDGGSTAQSNPPGLDCPQGSTHCEAELPKGSLITVRSDNHKFLALAKPAEDCTSDGSCTFSLKRSQRTRLELTPRKCSSDGFCWYNPLPLGNDLFRLWGSDARNVWSVGWGGTILKWNGSAWSPQSSGTAEHLVGVWGSDASNVWAVGFNGTILKWNGSAWSPQSSGTTEHLYGVWGSDASNVWVVGTNGTIV